MGDQAIRHSQHGGSQCAAACAYLEGSAFAAFTQSSQQTVISLPPTLTLIPPSLISQSQTGHFVEAMFLNLSSGSRPARPHDGSCLDPSTKGIVGNRPRIRLPDSCAFAAESAATRRG